MRYILSLVLLSWLVLACSKEAEPAAVPVPGKPGALKSDPRVREARRAYAGAPPTIPHDPHGAACISCHSGEGMAVKDLGFAPPNPHGEAQEGAMQRCVQCHVYSAAEGEFVSSRFVPLRRDAAQTDRAYPAAPPMIPHPLQLRENCLACHSGPAAREDIRCSHPERSNCRQCHLPQAGVAPFRR